MGSLAAYGYLAHSPQASAQAFPSGAAEAAVPAKTALPDFATIVAQQGPAVVNISVSGTLKTGMARVPGMPQMDPNDPFYEFFRHFQMPLPQGRVPTHGEGSGFIVSSDGIVLTNAHVVDDADQVTVKLTDKREFKAKVVGVDKPTDVAVLKIEAKNLPVVKIGDPQSTRVGEWVLAIGSPFGFENSVTAGIVSAKSRSLPDENYVPFLQTDVAINPGNSGGPLFNLNGQVIGINSQIYSRSGGYQGLSFAIPIDVAMKVERQLLDHGKVSRGRLGVMIQELNQPLAESFGLPKPEGALVSSVEKSSPAAKAGIEAGDVILKFNGKPIARSADLPPLVAGVAPGSSANVELLRNGKTQALTINVGEVPAGLAKNQTGSQNKGKLGLAVRSLTDEERRQLGVVDGLLVEDASGPAERAGIQRGDVVLALNGEKLSSPEQLQKLSQKAGKHVALLVQRGGQTLFVPLTLG
ncbi:MAG: DegQ family serine endoprotease [Sulfuricellaceae bacterium]|nr:DegQ family serine endoprotease [Sulfuricellaceae bacterium]